jgi:AraC-like DNA-binding protein
MTSTIGPGTARGLEGSCSPDGAGRIRCAGPVEGVELMRASFGGVAYDTHRHDTYAIGVTEAGVQQFDYRGATRTSTAGQVFVLHPDEPHDGRAGGADGFAYREVYVAPGRIAEAVRALCGRRSPLPFVREAVLTSAPLADAVHEAFRGFPAQPEPLACDALVHALARGLLAADPALRGSARPPACDLPALERARAFLDEACLRNVASHELEAVTGHSRYDLARQFRRVYGTSPYRYLLMRRLERVRARIAEGAALAETAAEAGFADQAHMTRQFKAAYGLTPARYRSLSRPA